MSHAPRAPGLAGIQPPAASVAPAVPAGKTIARGAGSPWIRRARHGRRPTPAAPSTATRLRAPMAVARGGGALRVLRSPARWTQILRSSASIALAARTFRAPRAKATRGTRRGERAELAFHRAVELGLRTTRASRVRDPGRRASGPAMDGSHSWNSTSRGRRDAMDRLLLWRGSGAHAPGRDRRRVPPGSSRSERSSPCRTSPKPRAPCLE